MATERELAELVGKWLGTKCTFKRYEEGLGQCEGDNHIFCCAVERARQDVVGAYNVLRMKDRTLP